MTGQALNCTMICRLIEPYVDGELSPLMRQAVASHLAECPQCATEAEELASLETLLMAWPVIGPGELVELDAVGQRLLAGPLVAAVQQQALREPRGSGDAWLVAVGGKALGGLRAGGRWAWRTVRRPGSTRLARSTKPAQWGSRRITEGWPTSLGRTAMSLASALGRRPAAVPSAQQASSPGRSQQASKQPAGRRRGIMAKATNEVGAMARASCRRAQTRLIGYGRLGWEAVTLG